MHKLLVCVSLLLIFGDVIWAGDKSDYFKGKVVKSEDVTSIEDAATSVSSRHIVTIAGTDAQYTAAYVVHVLGHRPKDFTAGQDITYRISGKNLFLKTEDGKQVKARLCSQQGNFMVCPGVAVSVDQH